MAGAGQSSCGVALVIEAIGSHIITEDKSSSSSSNAGKKSRRLGTKNELLERIILSSSDATDEEKATNRQRILNAKTTRWRKIFSQWPRDPEGKFISPEKNSAPGKMAPNKVQLWGATLFDFYIVTLIPETMSPVTFSSGSKLAAWMKANGENYAEDELDFAENEEDPYMILPYEITELIQDTDDFLKGVTCIGDKNSWIRDEQDKNVIGTGKEKHKEREYWQVPQPWPPASPFDPLAYPKPWPDKPFTRDLPKLEKYIMHSHLPTILNVHDPWNLLRADPWEDWTEKKKKDWSQKTDVVRTYKLKTSTTKTARRTEDDQLAEAEEARRKAVYNAFIADPHSRNELPSGIILPTDQEADEPAGGPAKPPIFVVFPSKPPIPPAREAHLYLSPSQSIGQGHHSFVYSAEFELPRSTFMEDEICHECITADMYRTLIEQDGPNGEHRDPKWDEKVGRYVLKTSGKPLQTLKMDETEYLLQPSTLHSTLEYEGPYRLIHSKIGYQCLERGPYCEHIATSPKGIHPLTAKVKVAAKLSVQDDPHLGREAEVYQAFPRHFFEHWSGFNVVRPINEPTPVGPLVPQFYGYYVPDIDPAESDSESEKYLSAILLLEKCGRELDPGKLTLDDQNEAAALVYRFHDAGWIHGSVAKRNIVIQPGPLSDMPITRFLNSKARDGHGVNWDFRLIDFGRAYEINDRSDPEIKNLIKTEENNIYRWIFLGADFN